LPFSSQTIKARCGLAFLLLLGVQCRPYMQLTYAVEPESPEPWKIIKESEDTLRAVHSRDGLELRILVAGRDFLPRHSIRMMQNRDAGDYDEQIVRIIARNSGSLPRDIEFNRVILESAGKTIRPLDAAAYDRQVYARGRLDYGFYFGQKSIYQFALPAPDYLLELEEDTASPAEKAERLRARLAGQLPWVSPRIAPGEIHAGYLIFPRLETTEYVLRLDQPDQTVLPPLKFQIRMIRRTSSEEAPEISVESRKYITEEEEWIRRMNEDFFAMHRQLHEHDRIRRQMEKDKP
jgi:hypothetical protein